MIYPVLHFTETNKFSESANYFLQNGVYTKAEPKSIGYIDFWVEEYKRIMEGYTVGDTTITGLHYFYLNYTKIKALSIDSYYTGKIKRKGLTFPRFLDLDHEYFWTLEKAKEENKGLILVKPRRRGFSYKNAAFGIYNAYFFKESSGLICAYSKEYSEGTMGFCKEMMNHLDEHTEFGKKKTVHNTKDYVKLSYLIKESNLQIEKGYKSEIRSLTFKDNPSAGIGKGSDWVLFEESGKWVGLLEAYSLMKDTFMDGDICTGMPIIYGTGGDMSKVTRDFCEMFYSPEHYNLLTLDNIWDKDRSGKCGYFIPDYVFKLPYVDKDGNSLRVEAKAAAEIARKKAKESRNANTFASEITQHPFCPSEAFLQATGNIFPIGLLQEQLTFILSSKKTESFGQPGILDWKPDGTIKWTPKDDVFEIAFGTDNDGKHDLTGCIVIYEHPIKENDGYIYIAGTDPYVQDNAKSSESLGSTIIYKRLKDTSQTYNIIVAEYTGRPETSDVYYENARKLLVYYNAVCLYENMFRDMMTYFSHKGCLYLLARQPEIIRDVLKDSKVERGYGVHMNIQIKSYCEDLINKWLITERSPGVLNLHTIQSINLIRELISYTREGNFDRVISFMMVLLLNEQVFLYSSYNGKNINNLDLFSKINKIYGLSS